jgi:NAD+ kinase
MRFGIIPNITKPEIVSALIQFLQKLSKYGFQYLIDESIVNTDFVGCNYYDKNKVCAKKNVIESSDIIVSIGGDGTMLNTAYDVHMFGKPMIGLNIGKLGFLAEFDINNIDSLFESIRANDYEIEERIALEGKILNEESKILFAINDIVIDKGPYPKMVKLTIEVDDNYVTTFTADGIILATPTGSTGYSLSTGGPIVSPKANVFTLSPISPHTLTMRHLVLSTEHIIRIKVDSVIPSIQINCDGQRVINKQSPLTIDVTKSKSSIKLIHIKSNNYYNTLRKKLFWGIDIRNGKGDI